MAHGQRDWSNIGADKLVFAMNDMAELAARLGSPVTFNREGNVLFVSAFEHGLAGFGLTPAGTDAEIITSAMWSRSGGYSCKLVAGKATLFYAQLYKTFPYPTMGKFGFELSFLLDTDVTQLDVELWIYDGTYQTIYVVRYDPAADVVKVRTSAASYPTVVSDVALSASVTIFHTLKLVVNSVTRQYERLLLNNSEYDLTAYSGYSIDNPVQAKMQIRVTDTGVVNKNAVVYLDDLILTQNES